MFKFCLFFQYDCCGLDNATDYIWYKRPIPEYCCIYDDNCTQVVTYDEMFKEGCFNIIVMGIEEIAYDVGTFTLTCAILYVSINNVSSMIFFHFLNSKVLLFNYIIYYIIYDSNLMISTISKIYEFSKISLNDLSNFSFD